MNEQNIRNKKFDFFLIVLFIISIAAFLIQAYFVSKVKYIGTDDMGHFSEAAENVLKGKGFSLDYINQYFFKFDSISHPEEFGFPGVSLILIPFILLFGKTAFAVKLHSLIIGVILFPILTYFLGKEFFNERIGYLAGISMIFYPTIFSINFGGWRDTMFAFFVVAGIYFFYRGLKTDSTKYFVLMGAFLGFSYLIRQATIAVFPAIILAYYLVNKKFSGETKGFRRNFQFRYPQTKSVVATHELISSRSKKFIYGLLFGAVIVSPWLIRNYLIFGDPFFTANIYVGWMVSYLGHYEEGFFSIWWYVTKPSPSYLISQTSQYPFYLFYIRRFFTNLFPQFADFIVLNVLAFVGIALASRQQITKRISRWAIFLISFSIFAFLFYKFAQVNSLVPQTTLLNTFFYMGLPSIPYIGILLTSFLFFRKDSKENTVFVLLWAAFALFSAVVWIFAIRYWLAIVPFLLIYSWFAIERFLHWLAEKTNKFDTEDAWRFLLIFLFVFILLSLPQTFGKFFDKNAEFPFKDDQDSQDVLSLSEKIKGITEKDDVIMGCRAGIFHFYTDRKYLELPSAPLKDVLILMKVYNVK